MRCCVMFIIERFLPTFPQHFSAVTAYLSCFCTASKATTYSGCLKLLAESSLFFREITRPAVQTLIKCSHSRHSYSAQRFMHFLVFESFLRWHCHCHCCSCCCHYWWQENKRAELNMLPRAFLPLPAQLLPTTSVLFRLLLLFLFFIFYGICH